VIHFAPVAPAGREWSLSYLTCMFTEALANLQHKPKPVFTLALYVLCTGFTLWLRFGLQAGCVINISYGLPLLICLWYPERKLLWSLLGTFTLASAYKVFYAMPELPHEDRLPTWSMQMTNMLVIGLAVHLVIDLMQRLRRKKAELETSNRDLTMHKEAISLKNEELKEQSEELVRQNKAIQCQADKLKSLAAELRQASDESIKRQAVLQTLLESLRSDNPHELPGRVCDLLISLLGGTADTVFILEKRGDELVVLAQAGPVKLPARRWAFERSFTSVVMERNHTVYVPDLSARPDLNGAPTGECTFRSVLATPLLFAGHPAGVVKVYSVERREWTQEQIKILEWISAQCSMLMDSRRLHNELQQANANLDHLVKERTAELQALVNELEYFSYTITHDLRAPLRAMHGFAGLLADECMPVINVQSREYLTRIITAANRMDRLITDALSYSKVVRNEMPKEPIDVRRLLHGMVDSYPIFQRPHAHIEIADDLPPVLGNEAGLTQCFSNLLGNAVKFVTPGKVPVVRISGERRGAKVRLCCDDNGIGIPKDLQSRVFVMFQRLSKNYEGTGIGLTLVKKVVERMDGTVGIESEPGNGSRFWIELNAADETTR